MAEPIFRVGRAGKKYVLVHVVVYNGCGRTYLSRWSSRQKIGYTSSVQRSFAIVENSLGRGMDAVILFFFTILKKNISLVTFNLNNQKTKCYNKQTAMFFGSK